MAGGRRPANYAASQRHNATVERNNYDRPSSPTIIATAHSLPLWPASIWQPSPPTDIPSATTIQTSTTSSSSPQPIQSSQPQSSAPITANHLAFDQQPYPSRQHASTLAQVLESTIETAIARHFSTNTSSINGFTDHSFHSNHNIHDSSAQSNPNTNSNHTHFMDCIQTLEKKLLDRDEQILQLNQRLDIIEKMYQDQIQTNQQTLQLFQSQFQTSLDKLNDESKIQRNWFTDVQNHLQSVDNNMVVMKNTSKKNDMEKENNIKKKLTDEIKKLSDQVNLQLNDMRKKQQFNENCIKQQDDHLTEIQKSRKIEINELRKTLHSNANQTTNIQTHMKKIESQLANVSHRVTNGNNDMNGVKNRLKDLESSMNEIKKETNEQKEQIYKNHESLQEEIKVTKNLIESDQCGNKCKFSNEDGPINNGNEWNQTQNRIQTMEGSMRGLKKLVESNLRAHGDAEEIVKKQVSLITKHVCVAMRQFTSRRIHENNVLLDKALRARIPEYAKNQERFVLVREEDSEGNDNVQVRPVEVSAKAAS